MNFLNRIGKKRLANSKTVLVMTENLIKGVENPLEIYKSVTEVIQKFVPSQTEPKKFQQSK